MTEIHVPVTYDAHNRPHIRQPHTTEGGAWVRARELASQDRSIALVEVLTFDVIEDE